MESNGDCAPRSGSLLGQDNSDAPETLPIKTMSSSMSTHKPEAEFTAAHRVFAIPELLEQIMLYATTSTKEEIAAGQDDHAIFQLAMPRLCPLQRVSKDFNNTLMGSQKLRRRLQSAKNTWEMSGGRILWLLTKLLGPENFRLHRNEQMCGPNVAVPKLDAVCRFEGLPLSRLRKFYDSEEG